MSFLTAAVQLTSTSDEQGNWESARALIERAASYGAQLVVTPENTNFLGPHDEKVHRAEGLDGPTCERFGGLARRLGIHLVLGSFNEKAPRPAVDPAPRPAVEPADGPSRCFNTSVLYGPEGDILAVYRKIHLFDVDISAEVSFVESATVRPGEEIVVASTELGCLGLTICYDLRFPELYAALVEKGAELLTVPSAFTLMTGKDHWVPLLRARAIENQAYVVAPAQSGQHDDAGIRHSYGHSLIIDPWGQVVASTSDGPGLALAELDLERVREVRSGMPVRQHRRL